jgi:hypothetical protein
MPFELVKRCPWNGRSGLVLGPIRNQASILYERLRKSINPNSRNLFQLVPITKFLAQIIMGCNPHLIDNLYGVRTCNAEYSIQLEHIKVTEWEITLTGSARHVAVRDVCECKINTKFTSCRSAAPSNITRIQCPVALIHHFEQPFVQEDYSRKLNCDPALRAITHMR